MGVCQGRCVMGFSANLLMPTCGGARPVPDGMFIENFNTPAGVNGYFKQVNITPPGLESYPSPGVVQLNGQQIFAYLSPAVPSSSDFFFEAKFFGPEIPVFTIYGETLGTPSSKWEVDFGALTNASPTVAHVVIGRQSGVNCAWLNGQKAYPSFNDSLSGLSDLIWTGSVAAPYRSYTLDAFRFAVGTYYDPAATTIPVPTGDLTW